MTTGMTCSLSRQDTLLVPIIIIVALLMLEYSVLLLPLPLKGLNDPRRPKDSTNQWSVCASSSAIFIFSLKNR